MFSSETFLAERIFAGSNYKFLVLSRTDIKTFVSELPYLIISITDPETPDAEIAESPNLKAILRMKFHDVGKPSRRFGIEFDSLITDISMTKEDAQKILSFVNKKLTEVELIVCHCEQGISRSAAIAAALSRILQNEDEFFFQHYWVNRWVYDLLLENSENLEPKYTNAR